MTGRASPGKCSPAAAAPAATWTHARLSTWWPPVFVSLDAMPGLRSRYFIDLTGFIKCLDKVAIAVVNSPMLARRLHHPPRRKSFPCILLRTLFRSLRSFSAPRPFFSITSTLFSQNTRGGGCSTNSPFAINNFQPLFPLPVATAATKHLAKDANPERPSEVEGSPSALSRHSPLFTAPLFSYSYKSLFPQPLSFHIHTKPRGCHPPADRRDTHTLA